VVDIEHLALNPYARAQLSRDLPYARPGVEQTIPFSGCEHLEGCGSHTLHLLMTGHGVKVMREVLL
jgi:hypothetical protein